MHNLTTELVQPDLVSFRIELAVVALLIKDNLVSALVKDHFSTIFLSLDTHAVLAGARYVALLVYLHDVAVFIVEDHATIKVTFDPKAMRIEADLLAIDFAHFIPVGVKLQQLTINQAYLEAVRVVAKPLSIHVAYLVTLFIELREMTVELTNFVPVIVIADGGAILLLSYFETMLVEAQQLSIDFPDLETFFVVATQSSAVLIFFHTEPVFVVASNCSIGQLFNAIAFFVVADVFIAVDYYSIAIIIEALLLSVLVLDNQIAKLVVLLRGGLPIGHCVVDYLLQLRNVLIVG